MATPRKAFEWNPKRKKYTYKESGRALSVQRVNQLRDEYIREQVTWSEGLASRVASGEMTAQAWESEMRQRLKKSSTAEYMLGRGGINTMTTDDMKVIEGVLRGQYDYLERFAAEVNADFLSEAQIRARSQLYFESTRQMHERGKASGWEVEADLPCYPGDGDTQCRSNCKCSWEFEENTTETLCYYRLNAAEHCEDCQDRAFQYNPFVITRTRETPEGD
jgi:hypothetical protein